MTQGLSGIQLHLVDNVDTAQQFIRWLGERRPLDLVAVDIETGELPGQHKNGALSPWKGRIRLAQVGDGMQGWAIPWDDWAGVFYQGMSNYTGNVACHNIAFEAKWFGVQSKWRIPWHKAHDTMIMAQIIDPVASAALKRLTSLHVDAKAAMLQTVLDEGMVENGWTWGTVPINYQPYWAYGALDPILTVRLAEKFLTDCGPGGAYAQPYELEMNARRICTQMEINGARVDLDYSQRKYDELSRYVSDMKDYIAMQYGGALATSSPQMIRLFERMGAQVTETTPSGSKSLSKDQLKLFSIEGSDEVKYLAKCLLEMRKADKLASSYFLNFLNDSVDGFVHPEIKTMGARTGRMSITNPALQTLPKGDELVRSAFRPRDEDHVLITSDLDQVEFRMFSSMSQDPNLINLFLRADAEGSDPFTEIGREVYGDPTMTKEDSRRGLIKGVVYGRLYGAGVAKQALTAGVPVGQMQAVSDAFDSAYPGMRAFQRAVGQLGDQRLRAEGTGYIHTWTGRRIPCDEDRTYTLVNYLIQGGAAEVFKTNLIKLDMADLTDYLIVPVHDEIVLQAPRQDAAEIAKIVQECMTTREGWAVPLTSGIDGPMENWGEKYVKKGK
jgi:DNA polymerase-1